MSDTGVMTTDDLASIKLHKVRQNSIHSFSLNFDRERARSKSLDFGEDQRVENGAGCHAAADETYVVLNLDVCEEENAENPVQLHFGYQPEAECKLASHQDTYDDDADSNCSDSSSFALQISKLAASAIESENETVEKWGEKLAKAIESKIGQPTSVVIKKASRSKTKKKGGKRGNRKAKRTSSPTIEAAVPDAADSQEHEG